MEAKQKKIAAGAVLLAVVIAVYWWFSPFLTMHQLQRAAVQGDAEGINRYVDYPALRESIRGQVAAQVTQKLAQDSGKNPFAALGAMLGGALINQMVDTMVRPETVKAMLRSGEVNLQPRRAAAPASASTEQTSKVVWTTQRSGADRLIAYPQQEGTAAGRAPGFVFVRHGFADWKLSEVQLPE